MFGEMGRWLMIAGGVLFLVGAVIFLAGRIPGLGRLPGDIAIQRDGFSLFMPCGTMIVVSIVLTVVLNLIGRLFR
ncbi:DUF2905 family protein [bacterium]|nr:DUF2905 family protein [bacterium]